MTNKPSRNIADTQLYTVGEIAEKLRISKRSVDRLIASGELEAHRVCTNRRRISETSLQRYLFLTRE